MEEIFFPVVMLGGLSIGWLYTLVYFKAKEGMIRRNDAEKAYTDTLSDAQFRAYVAMREASKGYKRFYEECEVVKRK